MQLQKAKDLLAAASTTAETPSSSDTGIADVHAKPTDVRSYPIIQFEFERVQNPLVIGIWILSASIAKIGKFSITNIISTLLNWITIYNDNCHIMPQCQ